MPLFQTWQSHVGYNACAIDYGKRNQIVNRYGDSTGKLNESTYMRKIADEFVVVVGCR